MSFKLHLSTSYSIGSNVISKVCTHKDLGIVISSDLNWEPHYNFILSEAYKMLGLYTTMFFLSKYHFPVQEAALYTYHFSDISFCFVLYCGNTTY